MEHACFVLSALLFWYPVVLPEPSRPRWSQWLVLPYLILADVQNTVLSALLSFSSRVLYPHYEQVPRLGVSALDDQAAAGVIMWVPGSIAYLVPLFAIAVTLLSGKERRGSRSRLVGEGSGGAQVLVPALARASSPPAIPESADSHAPRHPALSHQGRGCLDHANQRSDTALLILAMSPVTGAPHRLRSQRSPSPASDLTRVPVFGAFLRWRHARLSLQLILALLALFVIWDGLSGPQTGAMNLAGVLPWIHWRGILVFGLLVFGNVFCMACPFQLPRTLARYWRRTTRTWPSWLQSKWLAVGLVGLFLWAYEAFSLWDRPLWTAWIALGYFVTAFAVDNLFRDAAFCKYVCPIGQFNFVQSLLSPFEVRVREPAACADCRTHDCLRGNAQSVGCEMGLFQPRKTGNLDCTFCLDCLHACPHDNVGILATAPGPGLWSDRFRAGIGRLSQRLDLAALVLLLVFGAFANAAGMVAPVVAWEGRLSASLGPMWLTVGLYSLLALFVAPATLVGSAALIARSGGRLQASLAEVACRYAYSLAPIGGAMWLAHYSFHFLTSYASIVPTTQRFVRDLGGTFVGLPRWACACCLPVTDGLLKFEILALDVGLLASLYVAWRMACADTIRRSRALAAFLPWGALIVLLFVVGIWTIFQPMEMRGTLPTEVRP